MECLEEVRKHLSRLPSIDPNTRTLLVTGFPNVDYEDELSDLDDEQKHKLIKIREKKESDVEKRIRRIIKPTSGSSNCNLS